MTPTPELPDEFLLREMRAAMARTDPFNRAQAALDAIKACGYQLAHSSSIVLDEVELGSLPCGTNFITGILDAAYVAHDDCQTHSHGPTTIVTDDGLTDWPSNTKVYIPREGGV